MARSELSRTGRSLGCWIAAAAAAAVRERNCRTALQCRWMRSCRCLCLWSVERESGIPCQVDVLRIGRVGRSGLGRCIGCMAEVVVRESDVHMAGVVRILLLGRILAIDYLGLEIPCDSRLAARTAAHTGWGYFAADLRSQKNRSGTQVGSHSHPQLVIVVWEIWLILETCPLQETSLLLLQLPYPSSRHS